jgi:DnaD/phage-associated family protein
MEGAFRYLRRVDFLSDPQFLAGLASTSEAAQAAFDEALRRSLERSIFLGAEIRLGGAPEVLYFLNSPKGRAALKAIERGEWRPSSISQAPVELAPEPPNIFRLYEENIGPLTPLIADALRDSEAIYPLPWIEEAIRIAVENNKRSWRYVNAILDRWQQEGRDEPTNRRNTEKDRRRYSEWGN